MNALVIGVRRTGKSTLAFWLASERAKCIIIWDPNNNFRNPFFITAQNTQELNDAFDRLKEKEQPDITEVFVFRRQSNGNLYGKRTQLFIVRYLPSPNNLEEEFEEFSRIVRERMSGTYALLLDESDEAIQNRQTMSNALAWWMRRAPTESDAPETVHVIQMTHSPQDVYTRARNLLTDVYAFKTQGLPELEWIEDYAQNPEAADIARNLKTPSKTNPDLPREVIHIYDGPGGEKEIEVLTDQRLWYMDIGSNRGDRRFAGQDFKPQEKESVNGE